MYTPVEHPIHGYSDLMAGTTWTLGLLILCLAMSGLPVSGVLGVLFIVIWIGLGIAGLVRFFRRRRTNLSA
jgi:hypothetical protein